MRRIVAAGLGLVALATAVVLARGARAWNEELAVASDRHERW